MERPWAFHIECILPELRNVNAKKAPDSSISRLSKEISKLEIEIKEPKEKLDQLRRKREELVSLKAKVRE
ncbi:hypothetical protein MLD38_020790 [Melastoma candidum]|uniref:Uncharacterized protein n=1 Tax=Melastoma candidum TaxID=119954 RepID=A0ACB9QE57_9MYRT|nr:hypothetical protein MLD38_020790 [Melastoma candidum]